MPVDELDRLVGAGLRQEVAALDPLPPTALAHDLAARRRQRTRRRQQFGAGLATVVIAAVVAVVALLPGGAGTGVETGPSPFVDEGGGGQPGPVLPPGFGGPTGSAGRVAGSVAPLDLDALDNGWHEIDTTPLPPMDPSSVVWSGEELFVVGTAEGGVWGYRPLEGTWRQYAAPPALAGQLTLSIAGDRVVAVRNDLLAGHAAALDPATDTWTDLGRVPYNPGLLPAPNGGPRGPDETLGLVWTGTHLLDLTHGQVLDGTDGRWRPVALPGDITTYATTLFGRPVWDGRRARVVTWSSTDSLAWSADGTVVDAVPGVPPEIMGDVGTGAQAVGPGPGDVVAIGKSVDGTPTNAGMFELGTQRWRALPPLDGVEVATGCPGRSARAGIRFVVQPCWGDWPQLLSKDGWVPLQTGYPDTARSGRWFGTEVALWAWDGPSDGSVGPSGQSVVIWVPPTG